MHNEPDLVVPEPHREPLRKLATISDDQVELFLDAASGPPDTLDLDLIASRLADGVEGLTQADAYALTRGATSILSAVTAQNWSIDVTARHLADSDELALNPDQQKAFTERLSRLLATDLVSVLLDVAREFSTDRKMYHEGELALNTKLLFRSTDTSDVKPFGAWLQGSLVLTYHGDQGVSSVSVAVDRADIESLIDSLRRGLEHWKRQGEFFEDLGMLSLE